MVWPVRISVPRPIKNPIMARRPFQVSAKATNPKRGVDSVISVFEKNLDILNPLSILERGYSIIQNKSGSSIKSISEVESGDILTARLNKGFLDIEVKNKKDA